MLSVVCCCMLVVGKPVDICMVESEARSYVDVPGDVDSDV